MTHGTSPAPERVTKSSQIATGEAPFFSRISFIRLPCQRATNHAKRSLFCDRLCATCRVALVPRRVLALRGSKYLAMLCLFALNDFLLLARSQPALLPCPEGSSILIYRRVPHSAAFPFCNSVCLTFDAVKSTYLPTPGICWHLPPKRL